MILERLRNSIVTHCSSFSLDFSYVRLFLLYQGLSIHDGSGTISFVCVFVPTFIGSFFLLCGWRALLFFRFFVLELEHLFSLPRFGWADMHEYYNDDF